MSRYHIYVGTHLGCWVNEMLLAPHMLIVYFLGGRTKRTYFAKNI